MSLFTGHNVNCTAKNTQTHNTGPLNHNCLKENFSRVFARSTRDTRAHVETTNDLPSLQEGYSCAPCITHACESINEVMFHHNATLGNVQFVLMPVQLLHVCNYFLPSTRPEHSNTHFPLGAGSGRPTAVAFFSP